MKMIQRYMRLLQRYFDVDPDSVVFDRDAPDYTVDRVVARYETTGSCVQLYNAQDDVVFLDMRINRAPYRVRELLGMKAWDSRLDVGGFLSMAVDDSQKPTSWVQPDVFPHIDVCVAREHMAGQNITGAEFEYVEDTVKLSVYSGSQLLVCARGPREENEVSSFFNEPVKTETERNTAEKGLQYAVL